jgi:hypothetical protein
MLQYQVWDNSDSSESTKEGIKLKYEFQHKCDSAIIEKAVTI